VKGHLFYLFMVMDVWSRRILWPRPDSWLMDLCFEALACTLVPSNATWPRDLNERVAQRVEVAANVIILGSNPFSPRGSLL